MPRTYDRRTLIRAAIYYVVCGIPCILLSYFYTLPLRMQRLWGLDPEPGQAEQLSTLTGSTVGIIAVAGVAWFAVRSLQLSHPVLRKDYAEWLEQIGWNGDRHRLPADPAQPFTELVCVLFASLIVVPVSERVSSLLLLAWCITRMACVTSAMHRYFHQRDLILTIVLLGLAFIELGHWWFSLPAVAIGTFVFEKAHGAAVDRWAGRDVWEKNFGDVSARIWPLVHLQSDIKDRRFELSDAINWAATLAWVGFSVAYAVTNVIPAAGQVQHGPVTGVEMLLPWTFIMLGVLGWQFHVFRVSTWWTRPGLLTRLMTRRFFVSSWDQAFVPLLVGYVSVVVIAFLGPSWIPARIGMALFCQSAIMLRPFVDPVAWELTSPAQLLNHNTQQPRHVSARVRSAG